MAQKSGGKLIELLKKIEGLQTVETVQSSLGLTRQSAINLLSKLKKQGFVTVSGGGHQIRFYKITLTKQLKRSLGMFDILNKYNPNFKLAPWYDHQVHGKYNVEDVIVDAIKTKDFRVVLATLRLFNHIKDWKHLYKIANQENVWSQVGALYDTARLFMKTRKLPEKYGKNIKTNGWLQLTQLKNRNNFPDIQKKWHVYIPFNKNDINEVK